jgi:hypothetical protein
MGSESGDGIATDNAPSFNQYGLEVPPPNQIRPCGSWQTEWTASMPNPSRRVIIFQRRGLSRSKPPPSVPAQTFPSRSQKRLRRDRVVNPDSTSRWVHPAVRLNRNRPLL